MATLRNEWNLATLYKENFEEHRRINLVQNSSVPRSQEDYISHVSEENEGKVTTKLFQEFSRAESRILGVLSRLDDFLLNPLNQNHSRIAPETSRNTLRTSQGTNEDDFLSDLHPEVAGSHSQTSRNVGSGDVYDNILVLILEY